ncbi:hypothetical protein NSZ01_39070 [Nocardioides szechwanensis]|uniref:Uncharacterized protein n=1 Tax=Nocardioides szechwanensis TaxID=1005944 RepID=A0A1H0BM53_9ACTN|nr:hypothetical protein [Nocardioides szechwanensis]GEP36139.1 hypothetical protein NSZ01_39070 [Nocardioides szechwanensis]SDN46635.1 hypothetical protein SAMN05192576_2174 [Nocardioides szechwanensis]
MKDFAGTHSERTMSVTDAAVVSIGHFEELRRVRADVTSAALVLARELNDTGRRTDLDEAIAAFGLDRAELTAELAADLSASGSAARPA